MVDEFQAIGENIQDATARVSEEIFQQYKDVVTKPEVHILYINFMNGKSRCIHCIIIDSL